MIVRPSRSATIEGGGRGDALSGRQALPVIRHQIHWTIRPYAIEVRLPSTVAGITLQ